MKYLRMLTNAIVAGGLAAMFVLVLILQLNPTLSRNPFRMVRLALSVGVYYTLGVAAIAYATLILRQMFARDLFSPAWISVTVQAWLGAFVAAAGALVMWANVQTFSLVLEARTTEALVEGAIVVGAASALLFLTAIVQRYGVRRSVWAGWVATVDMLALVLPLVFRGPAVIVPFEAAPTGEVAPLSSSERSGRVTVIALDAGSLDIITGAAAEGRLPNFGRILDRGAVTHLATLHPTSPEAVWAAVATGKLPQKNGVRSGAVYRLARAADDTPIQLLPDYCFATGLVRYGVLTEEPRTSASMRTRTLWSILSSAGVTVGVLDFPLTAPAPFVRGFVVSDVYARASPPSAPDPASVFPGELQATVAEAARSLDRDASPPTFDALPNRYHNAARADHLYDRLQQTISASGPPDVMLVRYQSADPIAHYFLRYAMPSRFGDVSDDERRRYGRVLESYYAFVDEAIGRVIAAQDADDLLLVVSGFGIEPLSVGKRILERLIGDPDISGTHEAAPDGFLMAYGRFVAPSRQLRRASVVDVLPTLLYFLGLPIGRDMDGFARADLFERSFTEVRPIAFIPSYDR